MIVLLRVLIIYTRLVDRSKNVIKTTSIPNLITQKLTKEQKYARLKVYEALKKSYDVYNSSFAFNTLIAACMEAMNALNAQDNDEI